MSLDPVDVIAAIGAGLLTAGVSLVFIPAGLAVLGALLLLYAVGASRNEQPPDTTETPT